MVEGDLMLVMSGSAYYGVPIARVALSASFAVQVSSRTGTSQVQVDIEHRDRADTSWSSAGVLGTFNATGIYSNQFSGLKELVRYKYLFIAGADKDGMHVVAAAPQWLPD